MAPIRPTTPKKRRREEGSPQAPRRSARLTPSRSQSRAPSRTPSPSPSIPPVPKRPAPHKIEASSPPSQVFDQTAASLTASRWLETSRPTDPIFASSDLQRKIEAACGCDIQPVEHCYPEYFPPFAKLYGFERWIPTKDVRVMSKGPKCIDGGKRGAQCHKPYLPAFLYTMENVVCKYASKKTWPTLVFRWDHDDQQRMKLNACWSCHTRGQQGCDLIDVRVKPLQRRAQLPEASRIAAATLSPVDISAHLLNPLSGTRSSQSLRDSATTLPAPVKDHQDDTAPDVSNEDLATSISHSGSPKPNDEAQAAVASFELPMDGDTAQKLGVPGWRQYREERLKSRERSNTPFNDGNVITTVAHLPSATPRFIDRRVTDPLVHVKAPMETLSINHSAPFAWSKTDSATLALRNRLVEPFRMALRAAEQHVQMLSNAQQTCVNAIDETFAVLDKLSSQAMEDRAAIDAVKKDRDSKEEQMKTYDQHLSEYIQRHEREEADIKRLESQNDFLSKQLAKAKREAAIVDGRASAANDARNLANNERNEAVRKAAEAKQRAAEALLARDRADSALDEASQEIHELQTRLSILETRNNEWTSRTAIASEAVTENLSSGPDRSAGAALATAASFAQAPTLDPAQLPPARYGSEAVIDQVAAQAGVHSSTLAVQGVGAVSEGYSAGILLAPTALTSAVNTSEPTKAPDVQPQSQVRIDVDQPLSALQALPVQMDAQPVTTHVSRASLADEAGLLGATASTAHSETTA